MLVTQFQNLDMNRHSSYVQTREKGQTLSAGVFININRNEYGDVTLAMPTISNVRVSLTDSSHVLVDVRNLRLEGNHQEISATELGSSIQHPLTTAEEIIILAEMSRAVIERVANKMTFASIEAFANSIAIAILRTVQFPSPNLSLQGVRLMVQDVGNGQASTFGAEVWQNPQLQSPSEGLKSAKAVADNKARTEPSDLAYGKVGLDSNEKQEERIVQTGHLAILEESPFRIEDTSGCRDAEEVSMPDKLARPPKSTRERLTVTEGVL